MIAAIKLPSDALQYGFIGFGFLLALLAYYSYAQAMRKAATRGRMIMFFTLLGFSLSLAMMGLFAERSKFSEVNQLQQLRGELIYARNRIADQLKHKESAIQTLKEMQLAPNQRAQIDLIVGTLQTADDILSKVQQVDNP